MPPRCVIDLGRPTTKEQDRNEIIAYKEANINHIRTCHYPASENLLDACDELGIYVEQENAACFQGANGNDVNCGPEDFLYEFTEVIERDRNRPSFLIWSIANESGWGTSKGFQWEYD